MPIKLEACIDCKSILDSLVPPDTRIPTEQSLILLLLQVKELLVSGRLSKLWWIDTADMLADGLNKGLVSRQALTVAAFSGTWVLKHAAISHQEKHQVAQRETDAD